jgi:hypothetical protein
VCDDVQDGDGAEVADGAAVAVEGVGWENARLRETAKKISAEFRSRVNLVVMRSRLLIEDVSSVSMKTVLRFLYMASDKTEYDRAGN